ncbi:hypothetical protein JTB14_001269 [Gonioctena quinquepunctata]|nr:hypothetical protein JTB14_001269 [Gonioctena quinquepunctata]
MNFPQNVRDNKEILFGAFADRLTKADKVDKWKELSNLANSVCLIPADKEWTHARDTQWQNMEKTTMVRKRQRSITRKGEENSDDKKKKSLICKSEHLKLQNYKTKLEILPLETALHFPRSEFSQCYDVENISCGQEQCTTDSDL